MKKKRRSLKSVKPESVKKNIIRPRSASPKENQGASFNSYTGHEANREICNIGQKGAFKAGG